jgi:hypothetical protein
MISPTKLRENKIHCEATNAKKKAQRSQVYIARGNDEFEFVDVLDLPVSDKETLKDVFAAFEAENKALKDEMAKQGERVEELLSTLASLKQAVNGLENGKFKLMSFKGEN